MGICLSPQVRDAHSRRQINSPACQVRLARETEQMRFSDKVFRTQQVRVWGGDGLLQGFRGHKHDGMISKTIRTCALILVWLSSFWLKTFPVLGRWASRGRLCRVMSSLLTCLLWRWRRRSQSLMWNLTMLMLSKWTCLLKGSIPIRIFWEGSWNYLTSVWVPGKGATATSLCYQRSFGRDQGGASSKRAVGTRSWKINLWMGDLKTTINRRNQWV